MTDRERLILEEPEKMCESCCNFDKEHIGMDGTALCKLTMTLAYAEDYGGNCMFYNVPKEQIIIPPCKVGDTVYVISRYYTGDWEVYKCEIDTITIYKNNTFISCVANDVRFGKINFGLNVSEIGKTVFLTKEEAEKALKERK